MFAGASSPNIGPKPEPGGARPNDGEVPSHLQSHGMAPSGMGWYPLDIQPARPRMSWPAVPFLAKSSVKFPARRCTRTGWPVIPPRQRMTSLKVANRAEWVSATRIPCVPSRGSLRHHNSLTPGSWTLQLDPSGLRLRLYFREESG